jgi:excisionase family DNA binding protein
MSRSDREEVLKIRRFPMETIKRRILTIGEAAHLIDGITEYRIRTMCKSGQLRAFKAGKKYLIAESDLYDAVFGKSPETENGGAA